jgi:DNA-binding response OmpR family regulator
MRILLVEDERDVLDMLQEILTGEGHTTQTALDGAAGLACFLAGPFDIVFTDMNMPGISGFDVATEIKKINPLVPVVLLTGWDMECGPFDLKAQGIDLLMKKPFAITDILQAIKLLCPSSPVPDIQKNSEEKTKN